MDSSSSEPAIDPLWDDSATPDGALMPKQRPDGWTPFARALFLNVLAETGRVGLACQYTQRSRTTAYALRARDPVFAASWDAACELARVPLADALYERAMEGTTETITRNGEVIAERHRHDNRLSMAVLHRLDKRCDRAEERGARHLALVQRWHEWIEIVRKGEEQGAQLLLESVPEETVQHCQHCQLPLGKSPTDHVCDAAAAPHEIDCHERCWQDDYGTWLTDFPPPPDFEGMSKGTWGDDYERECTPEEVALLERLEGAQMAAGQDKDARLRDLWFELIREEVEGDRDEEEDSPSTRHSRESGNPAETKNLGPRLRGDDELSDRAATTTPPPSTKT